MGFLSSKMIRETRALLLLLVRNGLLRSLPSARVVLGILSANRQTPSVTDAAVAADLLQTLDVECDLTAEITLDDLGGIDDLADAGDFFVRQVLHPGIRVHVGVLKDTVGTGASDPINIGQSDFYAFFSR